MKHLRTAVILIGLAALAAYVVAFYATPMPSLPDDAGVPLLRIELLEMVLFVPKTMLFAHWFGTPAQFELLDRLPVLLAAGAILGWATLLGWLLLTVCRITRCLTRLETVVFAAVVGLNVLSTWTLLMGLLGQLDRTWLITLPASLTLAVACVSYWRQYSTSNSRGPTARGLQTADSVPLLRRSSAEHVVPLLRRSSAEHVVPLLRRSSAEHDPLPGTACKQAVAHDAEKCGQTVPASPSIDHDGAAEIITVQWLWLGLPFVLAILLAAMLPPLDFDVCEYHLQAPKEFLQQGRITFLPHNVYANMPLGAEMLSLLGMVLAGDWWLGALVGKTVTAAFTPLCALAIFAAGRRLYSTGVGVVASLVYISIPWIVDVSSAGLIEGASACYFFLALYAVLLSNELQKGDNLTAQKVHPMAFVILAGYLAGGAVATKYPAVLFVLIPLAVWTFVGHYKRGQRSGVRGQGWEGVIPQTPASERGRLNPLRTAFKALLVFLLAAAIGCGLWFGKNWAFTGNPTYPLLYEVFGGKTWNADKDWHWNQAHRAHEFSAGLLGESFGGVVLTSQLLSPLVVPLALFAFFPFAASRRLRWGLLAYVIFYLAAWWLLTHRIDRFWLSMLPALALLAGVGAYWNTGVWWRRLLEVLLFVGLATNFLLSTGGINNSWFIPLEQLRDTPPLWISDWHWYLNNDSSRGAVLTVGDAGVFDLKSPVLYSTCFDDCVFEQLVKGKTAEEIRAELASRHIAYVYVNWDEIARYRDTYGFTDFVQPEVFNWLVKQEVLEPVQSSSKLSGQVFRVNSEK